MSRAVILIGLALLALHALLVLRAFRFTRSAVRVPGVIVGFEEVEDKSGASSNGAPRRTYYPEVRFRTPEGQEHRFTSQGGSSGPAYRQGEVVAVLYPVGEPSAAEIESFSAIWAGPFAVGLLGAVAVTFGVGEWLRARRRRTKTVGTIVRLRG